MCNQGRKTACIYLLNGLQNLNVKGFEVKESNGRLELKFDSRPVFWERFVSDMVRDKVVLDLDAASKLSKVDNKVVYAVYNLWKFVDDYKNKSVLCDLTLLRHGIFSLECNGELFGTYGHVHEKRYGEFYKAIKNDCFLILVDHRIRKTYMVELKEGKSFLVRHNFMHKLIAKDKDCLVAGFTLPGTGHDYEVVKGRGFPFHLFKLDGEIVPVANPKYKNYKIEVKKNNSKLDAEKLFFKDIRKLIHLLKVI